MQSTSIDQSKLYRLPWTLPDNAISWLEPTSHCNLTCDGCYRENVKSSHKSLKEVQHEIEVFKRYRKTDGISIAGGDPLLHPDIVNIVKFIAQNGIKPIINTNGVALTKEFLKELKEAGVFGFTFHIDSKQGRGGRWQNKNELELNELRYHYARMLANEGGISCSFNATVYEDTLQYLPEMIRWAQHNIDIVHVMVFIAYRQIIPNMPLDWYAGGKKIDMDNFWYSVNKDRKVDILSTDMAAEIKKVFPEFEPCGYLNGTEKPDSFKWLLTVRVGSKKKIYGYMDSRFIELMQAGYHYLKGTYLAYASPYVTRLGKSILPLSLLNRSARKAALRFTGDALTNPFKLFSRLHYQSIMLIQPVDFLEDGSQNMCDGCPDITVWNDKLVWSCRLEEPKKFGRFAQTYPKVEDSDDY